VAIGRARQDDPMSPRPTATTVSTLLLLGALYAAPQVRGPELLPKLRLDELQDWATAVRSHEAGIADPGAIQIARWSPGKLYLLFTELRSLAAFRGNPRVSTKSEDNLSYPSPGLPPSEIATILGLTPEEIRTGNINHILYRAALLHTDIGLLVPNAAAWPSGSPFSGRVTISTMDGRQVGVTGAATHLELSSWLLDGVRPDPSADDVVRAWYQAVAAILQRARQSGDAEWLLARARAVFPSDTLILFYSGVVHEAMATPLLQAAIRAGGAPGRFTAGGESEPEELARASAFLSHAVEVDPAFAEARLHLGHVNGLLGRHESAAADLTVAAAQVKGKTLQYYAWLFLGREKDLLGDRDGAHESFARAAAAYPAAQSPLLAESELARRMGDSAGALAPLERLLTMPADESKRDDPWWWYDVSHVGDATMLVSAWHARFRGAK
jgi:tetratricopeptide (TPR) repeat protein